MEKEKFGFSGIAAPCLVIVINFVFAFIRWYEQIDGRYDTQQLFGVKSFTLKLQYAFGRCI